MIFIHAAQLHMLGVRLYSSTILLLEEYTDSLSNIYKCTYQQVDFNTRRIPGCMYEGWRFGSIFL